MKHDNDPKTLRVCAARVQAMAQALALVAKAYPDVSADADHLLALASALRTRIEGAVK